MFHTTRIRSYTGVKRQICTEQITLSKQLAAAAAASSPIIIIFFVIITFLCLLV
jgi:hypothetical protein